MSHRPQANPLASVHLDRFSRLRQRLPMTRVRCVILLVMAALYASSPASAVSDTSVQPFSKMSKFSPFVQRKGTQFVDAGRAFLVTGVNTHYLSWSSDTETLRVLNDASALGARVVRTFLGPAIGDPRSPETTTIWNYRAAGDSSSMNVHGHYFLSFDGRIARVNESASGLGKIDFLLAEAAKRKLKVILILVDFWKYAGGVPQMIAWRAGNAPIDPDGTAFFLSPQSRSDYLGMLESVTGHVNRLTGLAYRDDPTIFSWELMNEPQAPFSARNPWLIEMSNRLKSLDPNHLIGTGEDHLNVSDFAMPSIDYVTWHGYPKYYGISPARMEDLIKRNCDLARSYQKPVLLEEFGLGGSNADESKAEVYRRWLALMSADDDCSGWLVWRLVSRQDSGEYPADPIEKFDVVKDGGPVWSALANATREARDRQRQPDHALP